MKIIKKISKDKWIWMPHVGHLIVGNDCRFRLNTRIGKYIISTVGEYLPDNEVLKIFAKSRGYKKTLESIGDAIMANFLKENGGHEEIGYNRRYETMVFKAARDKENKCCPYTMQTPSDLEMQGYNSAEDAYRGHMKICNKYAKK